MAEQEQVNRQLKAHLSSLSAGPVRDVERVERLLFDCWHEFDGGDESGMRGYKVLNRTEQMNWNPPHLTFQMERHRATCMSSVYGEIQAWKLDLNLMTATVETIGKVQVRPKAKAVKTKPLAEAVTTLILERATDARLIWDSDKQVRIAIGEIIPFTVEQTTSNRRKRFRANLKALLEPHGWRMTRANNFEHE